MGYHAYHLLVGFLFGTYHFVGHALYQVERMLEAAVDEEGESAAVDVGIVQTDHPRLFFAEGCQLGGQRGVYFLYRFVQEAFKMDAQHLDGHGVGLRYVSVQVGDDDAHRRGLYQKVEEMILFAQAQAFVLQLVHHAVEDVHNAVGFVLSYGAEATAEVLFAQKLHTVSDGVHGLHNLIIKDDKVDQDECDRSFHYIIR